MGEFFCVWAGVVGDDLAGAEEFVFVDDQSFESYGAAGVDFARADTDFCAEAVAEAVAEARAAIPEYVCGIDQRHEPFGLVFFRCDNRIGMFRAVTCLYVR